MTTSTLTSKGQITIPKDIRERLSLKPGDRLEFQFTAHGKLVVELVDDKPLGRLPGLLDHLAPAQAVSVEDMRTGLRQRAQQKAQRKAKSK